MGARATLPRTKTPVGPEAASRDVATWVDVEQLLDRLAESGAPIPTDIAPNTRITCYQHGSRVMLESNLGSKWIGLDSIRGCWETFERLGRIRRADVLEPGRSSAFMFALFRQVPGVAERGAEDDPYLVL